MGLKCPFFIYFFIYIKCRAFVVHLNYTLKRERNNLTKRFNMFPRDYTFSHGRWTLTPRPQVGIDCKHLTKRRTILDRLKEWSK